jgi:hypothetical protein
MHAECLALAAAHCPYLRVHPYTPTERRRGEAPCGQEADVDADALGNREAGDRF